MQELNRFQQSALSSSSEFQAAILSESGTAAAQINGITIHSGFSKDLAAVANTGEHLDGVRLPKWAERFVEGQSRMDWQEKDVLVVVEVSMLGARTLYAVNEQLCRLCGSHQDAGRREL
ncbi:hypothetical protein OCS_01535 [Ophiocordyceps sinensis CO18]|nr:hypothetical protein OCS_01535 [Ophiocordyceps sinensis CO18]